MQSFDNRTAVIYTESGGASGKRRRKETAPSTILTKQFKRLSCLSFLLVHVWKESSSMAANEAEGRGEWKFDTSARIYTSRMTNGESSTESYSIFHFSRLQLNRFLVLISKCGKNNSLVFFFFCLRESNFVFSQECRCKSNAYPTNFVPDCVLIVRFEMR